MFLLNVRKAHKELEGKCKELGVSYQKQCVAEKPFTAQIYLNWPQKEGKELAMEYNSLENAIKEVAGKYSMKPIYSAPVLLSGGVETVFIGFGRKE